MTQAAALPNFRALGRDLINSGGYAPKTAEERRWIRACASKTWFRVEAVAHRSGARKGLKAYKCQFCPHWHLTRRLKGNNGTNN